jgi:serine/threonine-protein kinase RsbW
MTERHPTRNSSSVDDGHTVTLTLPLHVRHASTARMVAASLAADAGFSVDEIDDLRLGINEVVSVLVDEAPVDPGTRLAIQFDVAPGHVEATVARTDGAGAAELDDLAQRILDAVTDHYEYSRGAFRISKTVALRDDAD